MLLRSAVLAAGLAGMFTLKSPPWLSIESPVSPYNQATRGAALLVHAQLPSGSARLDEVTGTAEGIVDGARRSIPLRFTETPQSSVFALRRQWPAQGRWLLRISFHQATAIVSLDGAGNVLGARVPTESSNGMDLPREVTSKEIDSTLATLARR